DFSNASKRAGFPVCSSRWSLQVRAQLAQWKNNFPPASRLRKLSSGAWDRYSRNDDIPDIEAEHGDLRSSIKANGSRKSNSCDSALLRARRGAEASKAMAPPKNEN